jgi:hypothetical protein
MFEIQLPKDNAPKEKYDKLHDTHLGFAETCLTTTIPEQLQYYRDKMKKVVERKHWLEAVPNQAHWFFKFQTGVSDIMKGKCAPLNKATELEIARCYKAIVMRQGEIQKKVIVAAHQYPRDGGDSPKVPFTFKVFAKFYNDLVAGFDDFQQELTSKYKQAARKEKDAFALLKKYLDKKDAIKDALKKGNATESDYEKFKKKYESLAKNMD